MLYNLKDTLSYFNSFLFFYLGRYWKALFYAYRYASQNPSENYKIKYSDSAILVAKKINDNSILAEAYINKSTLLFAKKQHDVASNYLMLANKIAEKTNDDYLKYQTIYFIAQNYLYLGQ